MSDPYADELLDKWQTKHRRELEPCLWQTLAELLGKTVDEVQNDNDTYTLVCALNNGFRKGYWRLVVTPKPPECATCRDEGVLIQITEGPRKMWEGEPDLSKEGWFEYQEWERFEYHEERYWQKPCGDCDAGKRLNEILHDDKNNPNAAYGVPDWLKPKDDAPNDG